MTRAAVLVAVAAFALLAVPAFAVDAKRALRRREPEPGLDPAVTSDSEETEEGEYVEDFPHDKTFNDHADRLIPSHKHMMDVAKDVKGTQDVKTMVQQLEVLQNYLTKLSVRHEFLMEKYHQVLEGGQDRKLRRMVAEIVGEELHRREAKRENMIRDIVTQVVSILKQDLGLGANAEEAADASDEDLQQEAVQEAVQEALAARDGEAGGTDRVLSDVAGSDGADAQVERPVEDGSEASLEAAEEFNAQEEAY